jgi:O-antigen/teichoic acid export membrane protein
MINPIITKVAFPVFSKVQEDLKKLKTGYLKVIQLIASLNFPVMIGLAVVAPLAVPIIFGEQWLPSVILIQILTIVGVLRSTGNPIGSLLLARGRADLGFKWNLFITVLQVPGLYLGAKLGGTIGVAIAFALLQILLKIIGYPVILRQLLGPCLREYIDSTFPALVISVLMGGAVFCLGSVLKALPDHALLVTQVLSGILIYFALTLYKQRELAHEITAIILPKRSTLG